MIILDTAGDTIQAEASAASSITVSCYGIETASGVDTYKRLGVAQLTGSGTQDTIYTVPASTVTICSVIVIANTSASARTIKLWDVENGGSPGDANAILEAVAIAANSSIVWNKGNIQIMPETSGSYQPLDAELTSLAALSYAAASFVKMTGANTFALRTLQQTSDDLEATIDHDNLLNFAANEHYLQSAITEVGTIATGVWQGTDVGIAYGGTGQSTAQAAIDALSAVSGATNEHVLTKDTGTGNAIWKAAGGGVAAHAILDGSVHTDSVADAVTRGSIIYGNATPKWDELVVGAADTFLGSDGTDVSYRTAAQVMASLSAEAAAAFDFNSQDLTGVGAIGCGAITGTGVAAFEGASVTVGKASTTTGTIVLHDSNSANTITLTVPDISAGSLSFTLPPTDGANTNVLQTDGNGVLTWAAAGGGGAFTSQCRVGLTSNQTIQNVTQTLMNLNDEDFDVNNEWNSSTYRFTVKDAGKYAIIANVFISSLDDGDYCYGYIFVNGVSKQAFGGRNPANNASMYVNSVDLLVLAVNDFVEMKCKHDYGSSRTASASASNYFNFMAVYRIS